MTYYHTNSLDENYSFLPGEEIDSTDYAIENCYNMNGSCFIDITLKSRY